MTRSNHSQNDASRNNECRPCFQKDPGSLTGESTDSREDLGCRNRQRNSSWAPSLTGISSVSGCEVVQEREKSAFSRKAKRLVR